MKLKKEIKKQKLILNISILLIKIKKKTVRNYKFMIIVMFLLNNIV